MSCEKVVKELNNIDTHRTFKILRILKSMVGEAVRSPWIERKRVIREIQKIMVL